MNGEQIIGRCYGRADCLIAEARAKIVDQPISTHGVTHDTGLFCINQTTQEMALIFAQFGYALDHKPLIQGPVIECASKGLLIIIGAVGMVDRNRDKTLAGEVLAQMAHQIAIARIPVRNDDQRERTSRSIGYGIAYRPAKERGCNAGIPRDGCVLPQLHLVLRHYGWVPNLYD